ncbi:unnamed protein product [Brassica napus]|uniref:(rape) hypothetical protein n=1 Tax=Brassica napus TaxID=3708 RepID=A0A816JH47_BRANA|nr:unnamed protein product [Brassica napus]
MKTKLKSKNFKLQPPPSTINLHVIDNYFRCSGSVQIILITRNTIKHDPFGIYVGFRSVRIHFYQIGFGLFASPTRLCDRSSPVVFRDSD